jgi:tetratricopeptide (TPR) repeat protein
MDRLLKNSVGVGILIATVLWACAATRASEKNTPAAEQDEAVLFETAREFHMHGKIKEAIYYYRLSIEKKPTAQAHTFLGWALSHQGKYDEAIAQCLKAIELDPDYGNPYNDIGAYYIAKGLYDEAIPYLEKAIAAKNYEHYQFPHFNLGRVYIKKEKYLKAAEEFKKVLEIDPNNLPAMIYLEFLHQSMTEI